MIERFSVFGIAGAFLLSGLLDAVRAASTNDHLVPVEEYVDEGPAEYRKLWQQKLLVTPGETARFVGLPGTVGEETTVSVYRATGKVGGQPGDYWVTATQASSRLWNAIEPDAKGRTNPGTIRVHRCDAPLPESTALLIHEVWLAMLSQTRPEESHETLIEGSREIFSAVDSKGLVLKGQRSLNPGKNTLALMNLAFALMEYCDPPSGRAEKARRIDKAASDLLKRVRAGKSNGRTKDGKLGVSPHF